ncbi:DUF4349 domain-containing protein [Saccharicrinis aurantiacus]|uniref:DUF4349 domain-containing protein n=1 Tax=Saccharicrinis aurantiacus TaxID=1849719 RepID=UPI0024932F79|nr:DUF4349 domain-containing protein [Saccharicrinis aurantiacus]
MMKSILLIIISSLLIVSCSENEAEIASTHFEMGEEIIPITRQQEIAPPPPPLKGNKEIVKSKIIKDGRVGLKVTNLELTKVRIDSIVKRYDAYYSNESLNKTDWESSYNLVIRIPSSNFDNLVNALQLGNGEILYKEVDARDVTEQFVDLEIRLQNKRAYLKRYQELLKKAINIKEILQVEEKIRRLEEEIESTTGTLKYLSDLVDFSTLNLNIIKKKEIKSNPEKREKISKRIKQSFTMGWHGVIDFLLLIVRNWPLWIVALLTIYFIRKFIRRKK